MLCYYINWNLVQVRHLPGILVRSLRLSALMDLYIHPLKGLVIKILSSIPNSSASIHPLYHPLFTVVPTYHFV
jgi:hypothetical protein